MAKKKRIWGRWEAVGPSFAEGGQGRIYEVVDNSEAFVGTYVLKELKNPKRSHRFSSELEAIVKLSEHPNVIDIVDHGIFRSQDKPCYVMPKADSSLDEAIESKILSAEQKFDVFTKICLGVSFLHSKSIIHRDIKPENILLFSGIPKVADFGLCLIAGLSRETQTNEAVGPRYYMAPELEDGQCLNVNNKADIYSLGKLFYYILSNGEMFSREKYKEYTWRLENILKDSRFKIFNTFFERTINTNVSRRYSNVEELLSSLEGVINEYRNHPKTLLSERFSNLNESLSTEPEVLRTLSSQEWLELLTVLHADNVIFNQKFLSIACDSLTNDSLDILLKIILNNESHLDDLFVIDASKKLLKFSVENKSGFFFSKDDDLSKLVEKAARVIDVNTVNNISNFAASRFNSELMLQIVADNIGLLQCKEKADFLIFTFSKDYVGKENILTNIFEPEAMDLLSLEAVIAGLLKVGSENSIQLVFDFANNIDKDDEKAGAVFRGITLGLSKDNTESINSLNWTNRTIKVLLDVHSRVDSESVYD